MSKLPIEVTDRLLGRMVRLEARLRSLEAAVRPSPPPLTPGMGGVINDSDDGSWAVPRPRRRVER
jgi:hypothetical protein